MRMTYDSEADAAYFYIKDSIENGEAAYTEEFSPKEFESEALINLDFNVEGMLLGIEILSASRCLPKEALNHLTSTILVC